MTRFVGGTPVPIPIRMENDFRIDLDELASLVTPRTRLLVINSPANPTGGVLTRADLEAIAELAIRHDLVVLADEIYGRILYDGAEHVSIASLPGHGRADDRPRRLHQDLRDDRLAAGLRDRAAVARRRRTASSIINTISCAPTFAQVGAVEALRGPQEPMAAMVEEFRARRDLVVDGLNAIPGHPLPLARRARSTSSRTSPGRA